MSSSYASLKYTKMFATKTNMKSRIKIIPLFLWISILTGTAETNDIDEIQSSRYVYSVGDAKGCIAPGNDLLRLEVLPGGGWDNLRNKDAGMVMKLNYSKCLTTDDGRYLVPDQVYTIPRKRSKIDTYAELFTHWGNYSSLTSKSINAHAGLSWKGIGISGKHSEEFEEVKTRQFYDKSVTTRVQIRYLRYTAKIQPDFTLDDAFKARLKKIAAHIELNKTDLATYESQMVVRDFGTHVITSVDMGAALVQLDQVKESVFKSDETNQKNARKSASASFFKIFGGGASHGKSVTQTMIDEYENNRTHSEIISLGGPVFLPDNMSALDWGESLANDMVALDRSGDPIYLLISSTTLPDLPVSTVLKLHAYIKAAVELYYEYNTYRGCTNRDAPNFSFFANEDDGSCKVPSAEYTFGGVFQTCSSTGDASLCANLQQTNPLTGKYSCPDEYEAVRLQSDRKQFSIKHRKCHHCKLVHRCCQDKSHEEYATYTAYWCSPKDQSVKKSGFLFGGLYTSASFNPLTQSMDCPPEFYPLHLVGDLTICVADDYELGQKNSIPFAGFFSCKTGNPLALQAFTFLKSSGNQYSLLKYIENDGKGSLPRDCPQGFSRHLAVVDNGCQINYCIKSGALMVQALPKVKRPPFIPLPEDISMDEETEFSFSEDGTEWSDMIELTDATEVQTNNLKTNTGNDVKGSSILSPGSAAGMAAVGTLACVFVAFVVITWYRKYRKHKRMLGTYETLSYEGTSTGTEDTNLLRRVEANSLQQ